MSSPIDDDYTDQQTRSAWLSDGTSGDTFSDVHAEGASDLSTLPGYTLGSSAPQTSARDVSSTRLDSMPAGPMISDDAVTTEADTEAAQQQLNHLGAAALPSLQQQVEATSSRVSQAQSAAPIAAPASPMGPTVNPWQPAPSAQDSDQPQVNEWIDTSSPGVLSAQLTHADYSLMHAVAAAGTAAGGQAALVAKTVTIDPKANTITAGGLQPVGSRSVPAGSLARGSEYNTAPQFDCGPWFFPAVAAWAAANPTLPSAQQPEQSSGSPGQIEPGSQFAAEAGTSAMTSNFGKGIQDDVDSVTERTADRVIG